MRNKKIVTMDFTPEQRICHSLMLNAFCLKDVGLMSGKMGVLLALTEYCRHYPNLVYQDFTDDLIDNIWSHIHDKLPIGFAEGLSGIGWGVEFLIQRQVIDGTGVELCAEIDNRIMKQDPRRMDDLSLETGLEGVLYYVLVHIGGALQQQQPVPFDRIYLDDLYAALKAVKDTELNERMNDLMQQYADYYQYNKEPALSLSLKDLIEIEQPQEIDVVRPSYGLAKGLAGLLLKTTIYK